MRTRIVLTLGRDGMGDDATEEDYTRWVTYVAGRIDELCGFGVSVEERSDRDVQSDEIDGADDDQREAIREAKDALWEEWCKDGAP